MVSAAENFLLSTLDKNVTFEHGFGPFWVVRTVFPINPLASIRRGTIASQIYPHALRWVNAGCRQDDASAAKNVRFCAKWPKTDGRLLGNQNATADVQPSIG